MACTACSLASLVVPRRSYSTTQMLLQLLGVAEVAVLAGEQQRAHASGVNKAVALAGAAAAAAPGEDDEEPGSSQGAYRVVALPRSCFDDTHGTQLLQTYATAESQGAVGTAPGRAAHYLALGAAGALLQHVTRTGHAAAAGGAAGGAVLLMSHSVRVQLLGTTMHMQLERGIVDALEVRHATGLACIGGCVPSVAVLAPVLHVPHTCHAVLVSRSCGQAHGQAQGSRPPGCPVY